MQNIISHNFDVDIQIPSSKQKVKINEDFIEVNNQTILCSEVEAVKYGVSLIGGKNPTKKQYDIAVKDKAGKTLNISFSSNKVTELLEEDHTYYYIMTGLWQYTKKGLVNTLINKLNNDESFSVGEALVNRSGITVPFKTWFFGKTKQGLIEWSNSSHTLDKGFLVIESNASSKIKTKLSLHDEWNAVVLNTIMHYVGQDRRSEKLKRGEKI